MMGLSREPKSVYDLLESIVKNNKLSDVMICSQIDEIWKNLHDSKLSEYARIQSFSNGNLFIQTRSSTWRAEIQLRSAKLIEEINKKLGSELIKKLIIR